MKEDFFLGANYWASHAGLYMWRRYDEGTVEKDLQMLRSYGVNTIRIFPLWPDFQPLTEMRFFDTQAAESGSFRMRTGDQPLVYQKFPDSGLDEKQVKNMKHLLTVAKNNGLQVIVSFITGWMSGRKLVPDPFINRDLIKDAEVVLYECAFITDLISEIKEFENIIAYEPGNETNCLSREVDQYQAELWLRTITSTIRLADPTRPIYAGMHGTRCKGLWSLSSQGKIFDMVTPHPYPNFTPYCNRERLTAMRASMHAAVENSYYSSIAKKPSMVQEIGVLDALCDEKVPEYLETALITSYMTGTKGFLWWCAFDQENLNFAPYDVVGMETHLGLCYADCEPKPGLLKMRVLQKVIQEIGSLTAPETDAVCILSGINDHWKNAYGAFMLGVQSGKYIDFCHEEQPLKNANYYILPCVSGANGLPKCQWEVLEKRIQDGANLLITYNGGTIRNFEKWTGLRILGHEKVENAIEFDLQESVLKIERSQKLLVENIAAQIVAKDQEGNVVIAKKQYGKGLVLFVNAPLETFYTQSYYPEKTNLYKIYGSFFEGKKEIFAIRNQFVFKTVHKLNHEKIGVMLYNFNEDNTELEFSIDNQYTIEKVLYGEAVFNKLIMKEKYCYLLLKNNKS